MPASPDSLPQPTSAFSLTASPRHQLPVLRIEGPFSDESWLGLVLICKELEGSVRILDFSGVTHCQTSTDDAAAFGRQLARHAMTSFARPHHVLIAPGDLLFGLCRVIQMNLDMAQIKAGVFRTLDSAVKWLGEENQLPQPPSV
jgi:hypothetical protein